MNGTMTFNDVPTAMQTLLEQVRALSLQVTAMREEISIIRKNGSEHSIGEALICGVFRPGEIIKMHDKRLVEGESAPFASYYAVRMSRQNGCPWLSPDGSQKNYRISAESLRDWLMNRKNREKLFGRC